jgi:hypothetical protein
MAATFEECIDATHLRRKITAIIPSAGGPINPLLWAVFALLLRTPVHGLLEHFCVCLYGRFGTQDRKQAFLEALRDVEWRDHTGSRPMPVTVIRAWDEDGSAAQAAQMAVPWVHTDAYLLMRDDVLIRDPGWSAQVYERFYADDEVALTLWGPLPDHGSPADFLLCRKKWAMQAGACNLPLNWLAVWRNGHRLTLFDEDAVVQPAGRHDVGLLESEIYRNRLYGEIYDQYREEVGW